MTDEDVAVSSAAEAEERADGADAGGVTDHAELIERALAAVEADRADLARGHDGRSCLRQSEGAALAAALAAGPQAEKFAQLYRDAADELERARRELAQLKGVLELVLDPGAGAPDELRRAVLRALYPTGAEEEQPWR